MARIVRFLSWEQELKNTFSQERDSFFSQIPSEIARRGQDIAQEILAYHKLPRAIDLLKNLLSSDSGLSLPNGLVVVAQHLSQAKGRFQRKWEAPLGGLWLALALYDDFLPEIKGWVPLLFGIAIARALRRMQIRAWIKWINDVLVQGKKICGVLIEQYNFRGDKWFLVGVGLNVNNPLPAHLPAINMSQILGKNLSLSLVFAKVMVEISYSYGLLKAYEAQILEKRYEKIPPNPLYKEFLRLTDSLGKKVLFSFNLEEEPTSIGIVKGLAPSGALIIEKGGEEITFSSGEIAYLA